MDGVRTCVFGTCFKRVPNMFGSERVRTCLELFGSEHFLKHTEHFPNTGLPLAETTCQRPRMPRRPIPYAHTATHAQPPTTDASWLVRTLSCRKRFQPVADERGSGRIAVWADGKGGAFAPLMGTCPESLSYQVEDHENNQVQDHKSNQVQDHEIAQFEIT